MKKILALLICLLIFSGCQKEPEVVEVTYDYDYIDYLDIEFIGPDGYASMDINLKSFNASNFNSETDYIKMKKIINSLYDDVLASKYDEISNGDVIQIGIGTTFDVNELGDMSVYLGVHEISVAGLKPPKSLDLYDPQNVVFYGLEGTKKVYYYFPQSSEFTNEMKDNLGYIINIDDEVVKKNETVLSLEATLDNALLGSQRRYGTLTRYFGSNGYVVETAVEKTLKTTINESALETLNKSVVRKAVEEHVKEDGVEGYVLKQVMAIHKTDVPYEYYIVALFNKEDGEDPLYVKYSAMMAYVNNDIVFYQFDKESKTDEKYTVEPYGNAEILYRYELFEVPEEESAEEAVEQEVAS